MELQCFIAWYWVLHTPLPYWNKHDKTDRVFAAVKVVVRLDHYERVEVVVVVAVVVELALRCTEL